MTYDIVGGKNPDGPDDRDGHSTPVLVAPAARARLSGCEPDRPGHGTTGRQRPDSEHSESESAECHAGYGTVTAGVAIIHLES